MRPDKQNQTPLLEHNGPRPKCHVPRSSQGTSKKNIRWRAQRDKLQPCAPSAKTKNWLPRNRKKNKRGIVTLSNKKKNDQRTAAGIQD